MRILKLNHENSAMCVKIACNALAVGGMVIYPTETAYGVGVDATDYRAVDKLFKYKGGRGKKAVSVAVSSRQMAEKYVEVNEIADGLYDNFLPGPVTLVSKSKGAVVNRLESDQGTLGIRIPKHDFVLELIEAYGKPITATSANTSGKKTPYSIEDVVKYLSRLKLELVDAAIDCGKLIHNPPSTVVDTTLNDPKTLRRGKINIEQRSGYYVKSSSERDTRKIAESLVKVITPLLLKRPVIIALQGELGAGKTQFSKGLAGAMGITQLVPSPTYTLMREYDYSLKSISGKLFHIDTWRMSDAVELEGLGFSSMLKPKNVIVIEWLEKVKGEIEKQASESVLVWVEIEVKSDFGRVIKYKIES